MALRRLAVLRRALSPLLSLKYCSSWTPSYGHVTEEFVSCVTDAVGGGENVSRSRAVREQHGQDESYHPSLPADIVVFPQTLDHVTSVARLCHTHHIPLVPFGTGTGLEGGVGAVKVCVDNQQHTCPYIDNITGRCVC